MLYLNTIFGDDADKTQKFAIVPNAGYDPVAMFGSRCGMSVLFGDGQLRRAADYERRNSAIAAMICAASIKAGAWPVLGNSISRAFGPRWVISCATSAGRISDFVPRSSIKPGSGYGHKIDQKSIS